MAFIPTVEGYQQLSEAQWQYQIESAKDLAYIRINRIGSSTLHELREVEAKLRGKEIRGIVLDLRHGGGVLHDVVLVADGLLNEGKIGSMRSRQFCPRV